MPIRFAKTAALFAMGLLAEAASAAPPTNDLIANATVITVLPTTEAADLYDATASSTDPTDCDGGVPLGNTVWYEYTATSTGSLDVAGTTSSEDDGPKPFGVYSGAPGALTLVSCNYIDPFYTDTHIRFTPSVGVTYYILVGTEEPIDSTDVVTITLESSPPPNVGTISVASQSTGYSEFGFDAYGFLLEHHAVFELTFTCEVDISDIPFSATFTQGSNSASGTGTASCADGVGTYNMDVFSGSPFKTGNATVSATASNTDANYSASVSNAPTYISVTRKPIN